MIYDTPPVTFDNTFKDIPPDKIADSVLQDSLNIMYNDGSIESRYGLTQIGLGSIPDIITGIAYFRLMRDSDKFFVVFTTKDCYVYNEQKVRFDLKTRNYHNGTVSTSGTGYRTVSLGTPASTTATITHGSHIITVASASGISIGMVVKGTGIPDNTLVTNINGTAITLSKAVDKVMEFTGKLAIAGTGVTSVSSTSGLAVGQSITGTGILDNTTISALGSGTITLSKAAISTTAITGATISGSSLITSLNNVTGIAVGMAVSGTGVPAGAVIIAINGYTISLSANCTATASGVSLTISDSTARALTSPASGLSVSVNFSWAAWDNSTWTQTNLYELSFDSTKPEECTTWYTVASVDTNYQLTLAEDAVTKSASAYCLRLCYAGDEDDAWHYCTPYDPETNEIILMATNGVDRVQVWTGDMTDDYFENFEYYTNYCKFLGFYGSVGYEHILWTNVYDVGSSKYFESTIEISEAGALTFTGGIYYELLDTNSPIMGVMPLNTQLIIYKKDSISIAQPNPSGGNDDPFSIRQDVVQGIGVPSIRTVQNIGSKHILYTGDDIVMFNGYDHPSVATGNIKYIIRNVNKNYEHRAFSFLIPEKNLYCLMLPWGDSAYCNMCIVFDYMKNSWTYWQFSNAAGTPLLATCFGLFRKSYSPRWCDFIFTPTGTWTSGSNQITLSSVTGVEVGMRVKGTNVYDKSYITAINSMIITLDNNTTGAGSATALSIGWTAAQMEQRWSDLIISDNFERVLFAGAEGIIYEFHPDNLDDVGNAITATWRTKRYDVNKPGCDLRLLALTCCLQLKESQAASLQVRASVNAGRNWTTWQTVTFDGLETYMEKKVYFNATGKTAEFEFTSSTPFIFESMRIKVSGEYRSFKFDN